MKRFLKRLLFTALLGLWTFGSWCRAAEPAASDTWPVFRGNALSTGTAPCPLPKTLALKWQFTVKDGCFDSTPAIAEGRVYAADADGSIYAIDFESGRQIWKHTTDSSFVAPLAYRDHRVYVGDLDGLFYCLDASSGRVLWTHQSDAEIDGGAGFYQQNVLFTSQDGGLYCLDATSGKRQWKFSIENQIRCSLTIVQGHAFLAGCDAKLHIVDLTRGKETGVVDIEAPTGVTPAASGNDIFFGTEGSVFFCVDWRHAKIKWTFRDPKRHNSIRCSAALTDKYVVFGSRSTRVYAVARENGRLTWQFVSRHHVDAAPLVAGERIFIATTGGHLMALDTRTGNKRWDFEAGDSFSASPIAAAGRLVAACTDGTIYCFGK